MLPQLPPSLPTCFLAEGTLRRLRLRYLEGQEQRARHGTAAAAEAAVIPEAKAAAAPALTPVLLLRHPLQLPHALASSTGALQTAYV